MSYLLQEEGGTYIAALTCIEACVASLVLISAEELPKDIRNEDAVVNIIVAIKSHLLVNVLAVHSARIGNLHCSQQGEILSLRTGHLRQVPFSNHICQKSLTMHIF